MTKKKLIAKAKKLSEKYAMELEALFDDEGMTAELDDSDLFWCVRSSIDGALSVVAEADNT